MKIKKLMRFALALAFVGMLLCACACAEKITFSLGVFDHTASHARLRGSSETGVVLPMTEFAVEEGTSAGKAVRTALAESGLAFEMDGAGTYVESIGELGGDGLSGWLLCYNNDDFGGMGLATITLKDGDALEFHYAYNADGATDEMGYGWYGLPIFTRLCAGSTELCFARSTTYDASYNAVTTYTHNGTPLAGNGTQDDPFLVTLPVAPDADVTELALSFDTSLLAPYRVLSTDLTSPHDYSTPLDVSISTRGGQTAYYRITVNTDRCADIRDSQTPLTRAAFAGILARFIEPDTTSTAAFADVTARTPYAFSIEQLALHKITRGCGDTCYLPDTFITLEQALVMLYRYDCAEAENSAVAVLFPDNSLEGLSERILFTNDFGFSEWAKDGAAWCAGKGVFTIDETFDPQKTVTGAELATMLDVLSAH